jgi:Flp pilus assembly CpaE family ATPase
VRAARRALDVFHRLNYLAVPDRVQLIVNRRADKTPITPTQVEETLGLSIAHSIGNDFDTVSGSINVGQPFGFGPPLTRVARDLESLVRHLAASDPVLSEVGDKKGKRGSPAAAIGESTSLLRRLQLFRKG